MLDYLTGIVTGKTEKTVTIQVAGFGLAFMLPKIDEVTLEQKLTLFVSMGDKIIVLVVS